MIFSNVSYSKEHGTLSVFGGVTDTLKKYCSKENSPNSSLCLTAYLSYRCTVNFLFSDPFYVSQCINGVVALVAELDLTQVPVSEEQDNDDPLKLHQVAFSKRLLKTFLKPADQFKTMMNQYQLEFDDSYRFSNPHSLWERTLEDSGNNKEKALVTMVTLFQDFSSQGYFQFIDQATQKAASRIKERMQTNLMTANSFYHSVTTNRIDANRNPTYAIYPELKESEKLTPMIHHFYTPAYLALRLKKQGFSEGVAFYVSLLFNTSYEFIKLDRKMKTNRWPYRDPIAFDAKKYALQVEKIYTGYMGALWGLGLESKAISFERFSKRLSADPSGFISSLHY